MWSCCYLFFNRIVRQEEEFKKNFSGTKVDKCQSVGNREREKEIQRAQRLKGVVKKRAKKRERERASVAV